MNEIVLQHWPSEQLETVDRCPVCDCENSQLLESSLIDRMVTPATGLWKMRVCLDCGVAYLAPRPKEKFINTAYSNYYTHTSDKDNLVHARLRSMKVYFSERYYAVASKSGGFFDYVIYLAIRLIFPISSYIDAKSRHLFKVERAPGRLLDVGCGNGEFLKFANRFGWDVVGVDFDGAAVEEAQVGGFDVRVGGIEVIDGKERFDFISLNHVIEHVYDPVELIRSCYALLNDGGTLWLETPNIESVGYALYKSDWRGLEPPRHLMLFNRTALSKILKQSGFVSIEQKTHGLSGVYMALASEELKGKASPSGSLVMRIINKMAKIFRVAYLELAQFLSGKRREFITLVATR